MLRRETGIAQRRPDIPMPQDLLDAEQVGAGHDATAWGGMTQGMPACASNLSLTKCWAIDIPKEGIGAERCEWITHGRKHIRRIQKAIEGSQGRLRSVASCKKAASRLLKNPTAARAIEAIRAEGRTVAAYGLVEVMKEAEGGATFARKHKTRWHS